MVRCGIGKERRNGDSEQSEHQRNAHRISADLHADQLGIVHHASECGGYPFDLHRKRSAYAIGSIRQRIHRDRSERILFCSGKRNGSRCNPHGRSYHHLQEPRWQDVQHHAQGHRYKRRMDCGFNVDRQRVALYRTFGIHLHAGFCAHRDRLSQYDA